MWIQKTVITSQSNRIGASSNTIIYTIQLYILFINSIAYYILFVIIYY